MCESILASIVIGIVILGFAGINQICRIAKGKDGTSPGGGSLALLIGCVGYFVVGIICLIVFVIVAAFLGI